MRGELWRLTDLGRKRASSIYASEASDSVISYLYDLGKSKTASVEELSLHSGKSSQKVKAFLRGLQKQGLAERIG